MDKFIVRQPRAKIDKSPKKIHKRLKQTTIESLQGVVVVEDIYRQKAILKTPGQSKDKLLASLRALEQKNPSKEVLKTSKIGHTVKKLATHSDATVAQLAANVVDKWTAHHMSKLNRPTIEVRSDRKTEKFRQAARKFLTNALHTEESDCIIAENLEREAFRQHDRLLCESFRKTIRTLVFKLKNDSEVRAKVISGKQDIEQFVTQHRKQLR